MKESFCDLQDQCFVLRIASRGFTILLKGRFRVLPDLFNYACHIMSVGFGDPFQFGIISRGRVGGNLVAFLCP